MTGTSTRAERMTMPLARDSIRKIAEASGGCLRPVQLRRTDTVTGQCETIMIPCGATLASICPPCAERAKSLRISQCREGWHLEDEPDPGPAAPDQTQEYWLTLRAEAQVQRDRAEARDEDVTVYDVLIGELDAEITQAGVRGKVTTSTGSGRAKTRRVRSTRRRHDAPDLPKRKITPRTVGKVFSSPDGKSYRPSMFLTLTCDSYGQVKDDGTPVDPGTYDYTRAARDALHFSALTDRFIQNLRRTLGYDAQYFGAVEPQRRLAPHLHMAIRGAIPRAVVRQVIAATYHHPWGPCLSRGRGGLARWPLGRRAGAGLAAFLVAAGFVPPRGRGPAGAPAAWRPVGRWRGRTSWTPASGGRSSGARKSLRV